MECPKFTSGRPEIFRGITFWTTYQEKGDYVWPVVRGGQEKNYRLWGGGHGFFRITHDEKKSKRTKTAALHV